MAKWMTKEECGKQLRVGEFIMGSKAVSSDKRTIKVPAKSSASFFQCIFSYHILCRFIEMVVMCFFVKATRTIRGKNFW